MPERPNPNTEITEFSLDELEDITAETPVTPAELLDSDITEFTLDPTEAVTGEVPTIPKAMAEMAQTQSELADQVMRKLMPHLEELALETVQRIIDASEDAEFSNQEKEKEK